MLRRRVLAFAFGLVLAAAAAGTGPVRADDNEEKAVFTPPLRPELAIGRSDEYDYDPPVPGTYALPPLMGAGDGRILASEGKTQELHDILKGRISVLSFIYTRCADPTACPYATGALWEIHRVTRKDTELAESMQLITFSFDPEHDTPTVMENYGKGLRAGGTGADWLFLTTEDREQLTPILDAYRVRVDRKKNPDDPLGPLNHLLRVFLIDREAQVRNIYSFGLLDPRLVVTDVRTLLLEEQSETSME